MSGKNYLPKIVKKNESAILDEWVNEQLQASILRADLMAESELRQQSAEFLKAFQEALQGGEMVDIFSRQCEAVRAILENISKARAQHGFTATDTATFVFSLKQPLFTCLEKELRNDPKNQLKEIRRTTVLLDKLGLYTTEVYIKAREKVIARQQEEMLELSTPVVKLWEQSA